MMKIKVLYVDDEVINLEVFHSTFRRKYDVYTAISADEGMKIIDDNDISVIISDQRMPFKTGVTFFEEVKAKYPNKIRIILTAFADYETAYDSINKGAVYRFIQKPWDFEELSNTIEDSYKIYSLTKKNNDLLVQYQQLFDHQTNPVFIVEKNTHDILKVNKCGIEYFSLEETCFDINELFLFKDVVKNPNSVISLKNGKNENRKVIVKFEEVKWENSSCYLVSVEDQTDAIDFEKKKIDFYSEMQDKERKKLSMELHDGYAQDLVLLKLYFESVVNTDNKVHKDFMDVYQKIIGGIRSLSYSLNPPDLEDGLCTGLEKLFLRLDAVSETNFICEVNRSSPIHELVDDAKSYHLYRIVQEFVNNSMKHARSSEIKLGINISEGQFEMRLKDDGKGFDDSLVHTGVGLKNMRDRCRVSSMDFELTSALNSGTEIIVSFEE